MEPGNITLFRCYAKRPPMMTKNIFSIAIAAVLIAGVVSVVSLNATGRAAYAEDDNKMAGQMMDRHCITSFSETCSSARC